MYAPFIIGNSELCLRLCYICILIADTAFPVDQLGKHKQLKYVASILESEHKVGGE